MDIKELMKVTFIIGVSFVTFFYGCATSRQPSEENGIEIIKAGFRHWSEASAGQADNRERGTDLELVVANWPERAVPHYIVFRKMRSFPAEISDTTDAGIQIIARIVRSSALLAETSERVELSDGLVFTRSNGRPGFIEIEEWSAMEE